TDQGLVVAFLVRIGDRPVFRAVLRSVAIVPLLDAVAARVLGRFLVERLSEGKRESVAVGVPLHRHVERFAGVTNALEAAVLERAGLPAGAANDVDMAVARIER